MSLLVFSQTDSVSNGENVSPPKTLLNSASSCKILSKSENLSNPENLKTIFKIQSSRTPKISQAARFKITKNLSNPESHSNWQTVSFEILIKNKTVSKRDYNWP